MDLEVKLVFLDLKDLRDHKDPVDFLFKGFQWDLKINRLFLFDLLNSK